jgi:hypothetical protein
MSLKLLLISSMVLSVGAIAAPSKNVEEFFKDKTKIENPFELRDPFKAPHVKVDPNANKPWVTVGKGEYSNQSAANLSEITPDQIRVVGVLIGKERRAMIKTEKEKNVIILKEGMKLGPDLAELKAILPGGIILVEKIVNVYGQEEFLETVIPISR